MWVWYCRPPIGAHFHPTPNPTRSPPIGEKAHLRTVAAVLANATGDAGPAGAGLRRRRLQAGARLAVEGRRRLGRRRRLAVERRLVQATAVRRSQSSCYYYYLPSVAMIPREV